MREKCFTDTGPVYLYTVLSLSRIPFSICHYQLDKNTPLQEFLDFEFPKFAVQFKMGIENNTVANNGEFYDPMSVTWLGKYDEKFSKFWNKLPKFVGKCIAALATFLFGISVSGKWRFFVLVIFNFI